MSYDNRHSLKILGHDSVMMPFCEKCDDFKDGKFCSECGTILTEKETQVNPLAIIGELRNESEYVDHALEDSCNGTNVESDICKFSTKYPQLIFQLDIVWDSGFGDPPSRYYFKNGVKQDATPKVEFKSPKF